MNKQLWWFFGAVVGFSDVFKEKSDLKSVDLKGV